MPVIETIADLHKHLDDLEGEIRRRRTGRLEDDEQRREGEALEARAQALRERLAGVGSATWDDVKHELHDEWQALMQSMARWGERVDRSFDRK